MSNLFLMGVYMSCNVMQARELLKGIIDSIVEKECSKFLGGDYNEHLNNLIQAHKLLATNKSMFIEWRTDDIIERAKEHDIILDEDAAVEILSSMDDKHDANEGINWYVIDVFIENHVGDDSNE